MRILVIGDSHAYSGWNQIFLPNISIVINHIGPKLMYSVSEEGLNLYQFTNSEDTVIFCFGEIDARCHLHKYKHLGIESIIDSLVYRYLAMLSLYQSYLKKVVVFNVVPPVKKQSIVDNPEYPLTGEDEDRKYYVTCINKKLSEGCDKHGFVFMDVYEHYCDQEGFLRKDMSDGSVHIKEPLPLINFIKEYLIL